MDPDLQEVNQKLYDSIEHLKKELSAIRAGRATPSLIENVIVNAYGAQMKLVEVGTISVPQPSLLTIQIWDASVVKEVEKAIQEANLGLNPSTEGTTIRLPIPPLTEERRQEFVKLAHQKGEACRVEIRRIRGEQRDDWKEDQEGGVIGEDEFHRLEKLLQTTVDQATNEVDEAVKTKEQDLMQV